MNLRERILALGFILLMLQGVAVACLVYYWINPQLIKIETLLVEKKLRRCLENIQHELFHLQQLSQAIAQTAIVQKALRQPLTINDIANEDQLENSMYNYELSLLYILDNQKKVHWEKLLDLKNNQSYPESVLLSSLWNNFPAFLSHQNLLSIQAGIYQSPLGPILLVSTPIPSTQTRPSIQGTLMIGQRVNDEFIDLIENLTITNFKWWPLENTPLNEQQKTLIERVSKQQNHILIEPYGELLRGYVVLSDLTGNAAFILSVTTSYGLTNLFSRYLLCIVGVLFALEIILVGIVFKLLHHYFKKPIHHLTHQLNQDAKNKVISLETQTDPEMEAFNQALQGFITRQHLYCNRETNFSFRDGAQHMRQMMLQGFDDTAHRVFEMIILIEKKLFNLPTRDLAVITLDPRLPPKTSEKLTAINDLLQQYQKDMRQFLETLRQKILRNASQLRTKTRNTAISTKKVVSKRQKSLSIKN